MKTTGLVFIKVFLHISLSDSIDMLKGSLVLCHKAPQLPVRYESSQQESASAFRNSSTL